VTTGRLLICDKDIALGSGVMSVAKIFEIFNNQKLPGLPSL
jgi:hypothetical protein